MKGMILSCIGGMCLGTLLSTALKAHGMTPGNEDWWVIVLSCAALYGIAIYAVLFLHRK